MDNFTILPAFSNENEALNALALGLFHFGTEDIFTPDSVKNLINNALNSPFLANIRIKLNIQNYNTIIQHQKDLAENLITELYTKISDQINLPNSEFFNELYQPFEYAFLLYCANKNKFNHNRIPIYDLNNNRYLKTLSEFRKFSEFFKKKFTEDAEFSTFDRIYKNNNNNNTFSIENSLQAINLHTENLLNNPSPYPLREQWSYLYNIYLNAIKENEIPVANMELALLADWLHLGFYIEDSKVKEYYGTTYPYFSLKINNCSQWGLHIRLNNGNPHTNNFLLHYYNNLKLCYQFLDKIFDDGIFCTHSFNSQIPVGYKLQDNIYVTHHDKKLFFDKFRKHFIDEQSQLYGWGGLRNWVAKKDIDIRNSKKADGLNHTSKEFHDILKILLENKSQLRTLIKFIKKTSIHTSEYYKKLEKKWGFEPEWKYEALKLFKKLGYPRLDSPPPMFNSVKKMEIFNKLDKKCRNLFIKFSRSLFTYYTQYNLVIERDRYAQYLEQCNDPDKFIITFNRDIANQHFKIEHKIFPWIPIPTEQFINFCKMAGNFFYRAGKAFLINTELDRDTFTGFSYRRYHYLYSLFFWSSLIFIGCIAAIISAGVTSDQDSPAFDITNAITTAILSIATLFLGVAIINWCWKIPHDLYHDIDEKIRYRDDFGQVIYRLKLRNLLEKIETEITHEIITDQIVNAKIFNNENELCNTIREKVKKAFERPDNLLKIEETITNQINELPNKTVIIQDLLDNSGENLRQAGSRRAYVKRFFAGEIKNAVKHHTCYQIKRNYGFFQIIDDDKYKCHNNCFEIKIEQPQNPNNCYKFDDIKNIL